MSGEAVTEDLFFGGRARLTQFAAGHRVGHDAALLAACAPVTAGEMVDVGAGCGAAGIAAALDAPSAQVTLLEIDEPTAALARLNLAANGLERRGRVVRADLLEPAERRAAGLAAEAAAVVLTNPPFYERGRTRPSPDAGRGRAHVLAGGPEALAQWLRASLALVAPGGVLRLIHRADALGAVLAALEGRAGAIRVAPVRPRPGAPASRVLVAARKGARGPLAIEEGVTLRTADGSADSFAEGLLRGREKLWPAP